MSPITKNINGWEENVRVLLQATSDIVDREPGGGVNLAGKLENLFLVTIDVYRL